MQNLNKPADRVLTDLINETNAAYGNFVPFQYGALTFQNVKVLVGEDKNTSIEVTDVEEPSETDWLTLQYNRVSLTTVTNYKAPILAHDDTWTHVHDALPTINVRFGIQLTTSDVENDAIPSVESYPANLILRAKSGSLLYIGSSTIQLVDPDAGDQILTEPVTEFDAPMTGGFAEGSYFDSVAMSNGGFTVTENSEIEVGLAVVLVDGDGNVDGTPIPTDSVYNFLVAGDSQYGLAFNAFLKNPVNAGTFHELYSLRLVIESVGGSTQFFDMSLSHESGAYHLRSQDRLIDLTVANGGIHVGTEAGGEFLQGIINFADYPGVFAGYPKNDENSPYGTWHAFIVATRKSGEAPEVGNRITIQTVAVTDVRAYLLPQQSTTFQLVENATDDYTLDFIYRVHVVGLSGVALSPNPLINVTFTRVDSPKISFTPVTLSDSGITLNTVCEEGPAPASLMMTCTGIIPSGLANGIYDISGQMVVAASWNVDEDGSSIPMDISFTGTRGEIVSSSIDWQVEVEDAGGGPGDNDPSYVPPSASVIWDPSDNRFTLNQEFFDEIANDYAEVLIEWEVDGTVLHRDSDDDREVHWTYPAPTIADIPINGNELSANITVRKNDTYYTSTATPYTMSSSVNNLMSDVTHAVITGVTIEDYTLTGITITPAVFPGFDSEVHEIRTKLYSLAISGEGWALIDESPLSGVEFELPSKGNLSLIVEQTMVEIGSGPYYSDVIKASRSAEFLVDCNPGAGHTTSKGSRDDTLIACVGRPEILRAVDDSIPSPAIVWPGRWYLPRRAKLQIHKGSHLPRDSEFDPQSPGNLFTTSMSQVTSDSTYSAVAGDDIVLYIIAQSEHDTLPINYYDVEGSRRSIIVSSPVSTLLTEVEGEDEQLPTLTAPVVDSVSCGNIYSVHPVAPLAGSVRRVWLQWSTRHVNNDGPNEWQDGGFSWADSITTFTSSEDFNGIVYVYNPDYLSNGSQIEVRAAMIVEYDDDSVAFSDWSSPFTMTQTYQFNGYYNSVVGGSGLSTYDWTGGQNTSNLIDDALNANGYAIVTSAYKKGVEIFDGTTEYRLEPAPIDGITYLFSDDQLMQDGSPVVTSDNRFEAQVTFYDSNDQVIGSAFGNMKWTPVV